MTQKPRILWVDDDHFRLHGLTFNLSAEGYIVETAGDVRTAKLMIDKNPPDLAILDMMLPLGSDDEDIFEARGGFASGLLLAKWIKANHPNVRFIGCSVVRDREVTGFFSKYGCGFISKGSILPRDLSRLVAQALEIPSPTLDLRSFIVHGHDDAAKWELKNYIQNILKLPEPLILHELPSLGRTIIEKFEDTTEDIDIVFVLLTPDDKGAAASDDNMTKRRARQNVIFELGYFLASMRRCSGRVLLLHKGALELPSDINGLVYVDISNGIEAAGEEIRREIATLV